MGGQITMGRQIDRSVDLVTAVWGTTSSERPCRSSVVLAAPRPACIAFII